MVANASDPLGNLGASQKSTPWQKAESTMKFWEILPLYRHQNFVEFLCGHRRRNKTTPGGVRHKPKNVLRSHRHGYFRSTTLTTRPVMAATSVVPTTILAIGLTGSQVPSRSRF